MRNFLALLGWSPGDNRELFSRAELIDAFTLEGISGGNAVFNIEKLEWFNQQHIAQLAPDELALRIKPSFEHAGFWRDEFLGDRHTWFFAILDLLKPRAKRLGDFVSLGRFFFSSDLEFDEGAVDKYLRADAMSGHVAALAASLAELPSFDAASTESALRATAESRGVKAASLIHAVRVAVTGKAVSPGLFDVLSLLGRDEVERRLTRALERLSASDS